MRPKKNTSAQARRIALGLALPLIGSCDGCRDQAEMTDSTLEAGDEPPVVREARTETLEWASGETRTVKVAVPRHEVDTQALAPLEKALSLAGLSLDRLVVQGVRQRSDGFTVLALPLHQGIAVRKDLALSFNTEGRLAPGAEHAAPSLGDVAAEPAVTATAAAKTLLAVALERDRNSVGEIEAQLFYERDEGSQRWRLVWGIGLGGAGSGFIDAVSGELLVYEPGGGTAAEGRSAARRKRPIEELPGVSVELGESRLLTIPAAIFFTDPSRGYLVADYGRILSTRDGGRTFRNHESGTEVDTLHSAWFTNADVGFVGGGCRRPLCEKDRATILVTRDGGATFRLDALDSAPITSIGFADAERGFALSQNAIWRTVDAGETWVKKDAPSDPAVRNISVHRGALVGSAPGGGVFMSEDGGETWIEKGRIAGRGALPIFWVDELRGVAREAKALHWTADRGVTWSTHPSDLGPARRMWFVDDKTGFAIASDALLGTRDGGIHWVRLTDPAETGVLTELFFPTPDQGFAIGRRVMRIAIR